MNNNNWNSNFNKKYNQVFVEQIQIMNKKIEYGNSLNYYKPEQKIKKLNPQQQRWENYLNKNIKSEQIYNHPEGKLIKQLLNTSINKYRSNGRLSILAACEDSSTLEQLRNERLRAQQRQREISELKKALEKERETEKKVEIEVIAVDEDHICSICMDAKKDMIILPCFHMCACETCSKQLPAECPVCRGKILEIRKVYNT